MKKTVVSIFLAAALATAASADMWRVEGGLGFWAADPSGTVTDNNVPGGDTLHTNDILGYDKENHGYIWLNIKHPIPVLPNLRLEHLNKSYSANNHITDDITWNGESFGANTTIDSTLKMDQTDVILYYNILDNTGWVTADLGLDIKIMDLAFDMVGDDGSGNRSETHESETVPLPLLYGRLRSDIPGTELGIEGDLKYLKISDSKVFDARIKVDYSFDLEVVKPAIEVGYRVQEIIVDESSADVKTDIKFSGFYAGVMVRF
jgi:outer membrane protein